MAKPKLKRVVRKRREKKLVERGAAHIRSSFNNTMTSTISKLSKPKSSLSNASVENLSCATSNSSPKHTFSFSVICCLSMLVIFFE